MADNLIVSDPQILGGKPCVRGTRLSVEFLLELAASGATQEQILAQYPQLCCRSLKTDQDNIAGRLDEWLQPLPARSEFALTAKPGDFLSKTRPGSFTQDSELRLTLGVTPPHPQALLLKYWSGTMTSNNCVVN